MEPAILATGILEQTPKFSQESFYALCDRLSLSSHFYSD